VKPQAKSGANTQLFRKLPSVDELAHAGALAALATAHGMPAVTDAARAVLDRLRGRIAEGLLDESGLDESGLDLALSGITGAVEAELRRTVEYSLRAVINATGVILHTNLGRAPLAESAIEHIRQTAANYSNLEFDLTAGERSQRDGHIDRLLQSLFAGQAPTGPSGEERPSVATIVVNNNAAAVLLALNTLAEGGEVVVSRGELVEIGGSFRIPDVMGKSGAMLREVGTTNRTRAADYEQAINERTRLLLRVHRSNFEITGFTEQATTAELAALARQYGVPLMEDLGSGALIDLHAIGLDGEDSVFDSTRAGVDVVTYSGDKLLGGPQAGLISGRRALIAHMRSNSLFRALRPDKLTYAALEATLLAYVKRDHDAIPALRMMRLQKGEIGKRAEVIAAAVRTPKLQVELLDGESVIGGGAAPSSVLPTRLLALRCEGLSADELARRLRAGDPPVIARIEDGRVMLDLRTAFPEQDQFVVRAIMSSAHVSAVPSGSLNKLEK
jgi:L-seryl-tRNA(Ser) seleniumtransferase